MRKVNLTSLNCLSILSREEKRNVYGGCISPSCISEPGGYWENSGDGCDIKECPDYDGMPVRCLEKNYMESYCWYWHGN